MKHFRNLPVISLCLTGVYLFVSPGIAWSHGGEDHSGESLATGAGPTLGAPIHVPKPTQFLLGIETARAVEKTVPRQLKTLGHVTIPTLQQAEVYSPFQGLLVTADSFSVPQLGQHIKKGAVVALAEQVINAPETLSVITEIAKTKSELGQAREEYSLAKIEMDRVGKLGDAVSGRRLAEAKAAVVVAREKVSGWEQALGEMRQGLSLDKDNPRIVSVHAPIDGVIVASHVTPGEYIEPQKLLFEIIDNSKVWVEADIYEMDLRLVEDANRAVIISEAYPSEEFIGHLDFVGLQLDPDTRTVKAVFIVENPAGRLRGGMVVNVLIETTNQETGTMFPKAAVVNEKGQSVVYVKIAPETFIARPIRIRGVWGDKVMVESGIEPDEIVVVQGMYQVRNSAT